MLKLKAEEQAKQLAEARQALDARRTVAVRFGVLSWPLSIAMAGLAVLLIGGMQAIGL